jgi:UDP-2,3-diacylglucosamine pyrophosphatase LpxH
MTQVMTKKFKDEYIKPLILQAVNKVEDFKKNKQKGDKIVYYEGNFQEDVLNNFSNKESEEIFNTMKKYLNDYRLIFLQKKIKINDINSQMSELNEPKHYFSYIVSKRVF